MSQKTWCFTVPNYTEENLKVLDNIECSYIVYGKELAPTTGTPHLQGYVIFKRAHRLAQLRTFLPGAHFEPAKAQEQAANYCMKDGNFTVRDNRTQGKRNDITDFIKDIHEQGFVSAIPQHAECFVKYASGFEKYNLYTQTLHERHPPNVYWLYGETGVGKTRYVHDQEKELWVSNGDLRWFDGYHGQSAALFDDFRPDQCPWHFLLKLLDRYPLRVPIKGGFAEWRPHNIYITSPLSPEQAFVGQAEDIQQLLRRLTGSYHVTDYMTFNIP